MKTRNLLTMGVTLMVGASMNAQINLNSNLRACLPLNGNANDISGNGNNGVIVGATPTTDRFGNPNSAYSFGTGKYITLPNLSNFQTNNEMTISLWGKTTFNTSNCLFILNPDNYYDRCVGCAGYDNGAGGTMAIFDYGDLYGTGRTVYQNLPVDLSNWHHYVFVISQSGNFKRIYRDGVKLIEDQYLSTCMNKNLPLQIGGGYDQGGGNIFFRGNIDDICIYNRALNDSEIVALYNNINTCFVTGINLISQNIKMIVYPTISNDGIYKLNSLDIGTIIEVYSLEGKLVERFKYDLNNNTIDLSKYNDGTYIIKAQSENKIFTEKVVKISN
jgi:hypothetical protein